MKKIKGFNSFINESTNSTELQNLSLFYKGDKFEVKITNYSKPDHWYKNLIDEVFVVSKDDRSNDWKVVPKILFDFFNIEDNYPAYDKIGRAVYYISKNDCEIIKNLS